MLPRRVFTRGLGALLATGAMATGAAAHAYQAAEPDPAAARAGAATNREGSVVASPTEGLLTVTGVVHMRDGSPAVGATVRSVTESDEAPIVARTDASGRFQIQSVFGNGCRLHASSADGGQQAVLKVRSAVRSALAAPVELKLLPALSHEVVVMSEGRPVAGARVAALGIDFQVQGVTGEDGKARLRFPARERIDDLVAWHPTLGVAGKQDLENRPREGSTQLSLLPPAPLRIQVIDADGKPIGGVELALSVRTEDSDGILAGCLEASHVRTDAAGAAIAPWTPREKLKYVGVESVGADWKIDETDLGRIGAGVITVHARRRRTVRGRLVMPAGARAQGILIKGFGGGLTSNGHFTYARARRDGTFDIGVCSDHGYVLAIDDLEWAGDPWSGLILVQDTARPAEITMSVYPATPLTVRVARGPGREPVANAWVELNRGGQVNWTDRAGKKHSGSGGIRSWLTTDAQGVVRLGVGKGRHTVRLSSADWAEERRVEATSGVPLEIEFHRAWLGKRRVAGWLMSEGARFTPSRALMVRAWAPRPAGPIPPDFAPVVHPDGSFEVAFDAESAALFFLDRPHQRSGFAERLQGGVDLEVTMEPTATFGGTLVDDHARPVGARTLEMYLDGSGGTLLAIARTDRAGRFRFTGVPTGVALEFSTPREVEGSRYSIVEDRRMFKPGEVRDHDRLTLHREDSSSPIASFAEPLARSVERICRDARSSGLRGLAVVVGDDSGDAARIVDQLLDHEDERRSRVVLSYLPVRVGLAQLKREAAIVAGYGWPRPVLGEIVLVALDGDQKTIATRRLATTHVASAVDDGMEFLKRHGPPQRDALRLLAEARNQAQRSGRRVWVVYGGPRCGPCFRLARWIEDQQAVLDKDFVVVKLMEGVDLHVDQAIVGLPFNIGDGIPWFAFTEPDGTVLAISRGQAGNIGFPRAEEGIRHFRRMLEAAVRRTTADELDRLMILLSKGR